MSSKVGLLMVSGLLLFYGFHLLEAQEAAGPRIKFESTEFDFGDVNEGEKLTHIYRFKNTGDDTLEIKKVRAS